MSPLKGPQQGTTNPPMRLDPLTSLIVGLCLLLTITLTTDLFYFVDDPFRVLTGMVLGVALGLVITGVVKMWVRRL